MDCPQKTTLPFHAVDAAPVAAGHVTPDNGQTARGTGLNPAVLPLIIPLGPEQLLTDVLDHLPEGVAVLSHDGTLLRVNQAMAAALGADHSDTVHEHGLGEFIHSRQRRAFLQALSQALCGTSTTLEVQRQGASDACPWHEARLTPLGTAMSGGLHPAVLCTMHDISIRKRAEDLQWRQSHVDRLTDLPNRKTFQETLARTIRQSLQTDTGLALILIDLNRLSDINETMGFEAGDAVLVEVSRRLQHQLSVGDFSARVAGDKFAITLTPGGSYDSTQALTTALLEAVRQPIHIGSDSVVVTASAGVTFFPADARHPEALLKNAEQALRAAREQGRHQVAFFSPAMQTALQNRMRLIADLRQAVETRQLALHMQPIVDMTSRRIVGAEALLRWEHSVHGQISPAVFIPLAEETGLITVIGDAVFRDAAHWAKRWIHLCGDTFHVAVNQSPIQFRNQQGVLAWLDHLKTIDLPAGNMVIEITEGLLLDADADTRTLLAQLQGAGLRLAIDDFGTGYSSLSYLHKFPVDLIKIDQSFVRDLSWESGARTLSESIVAMAHKLGISVIAEGVETAEQHEILMRAGCDCAQGYHYARPMSTTAFDSLLRETGGILPPLAASA